MTIAADVAAPQIPVGLQGKLTKENFGPSIPSYAPTLPQFRPRGMVVDQHRCGPDRLYDKRRGGG